jgi:hypothetical protein
MAQGRVPSLGYYYLRTVLLAAAVGLSITKGRMEKTPMSKGSDETQGPSTALRSGRDDRPD